jgi:hypothetical protein
MTRTGDRKNAYKILEGRNNSEIPCVHGSIISDWIHLTHYRDQWLDLVETVMNLSRSTNGGEFLEHSMEQWLFKKDSTAWSWLAS